MMPVGVAPCSHLPKLPRVRRFHLSAIGVTPSSKGNAFLNPLTSFQSHLTTQRTARAERFACLRIPSLLSTIRTFFRHRVSPRTKVEGRRRKRIRRRCDQEAMRQRSFWRHTRSSSCRLLLKGRYGSTKKFRYVPVSNPLAHEF